MTFRMNFCFLLSISCILLNSYVNSAEFVPVYMWTTETKISNHVPALHKISADSFKEVMLDYLKTNPYVVVFTEQTLSPEDFAQRDQNGDTLYPNLSKFKESTSIVSYLPYVQNPIKSLKHLNKEFTETSIEKFSNDDLSKDTILIINLNDAEDNEDRTDMLKRHDSSINTIFNDIIKKYDNVLVLYTARHTSWVAPEDVPHQRQARSLLAAGDEESKAIILKHDQWIVFYASEILFNNDTKTGVVLTEAVDKDTYTISSANPPFALTFGGIMSGYWVLTNVSVNGNDAVARDIAAPHRFSFHCTNQTFKSTKTNDVLKINDFQVQPWFDAIGRGNHTYFGDSYDCVGFTSVPIWSGIFITFILLFILTAGITMMIDIKTMDRFDDPKGKTITINASE